MVKRILVCALALLLALGCACPVLAEEGAVAFAQGEPLTLLQRDGIEIRLSGKVVPVENPSGFVVEVTGVTGDEDKTAQQLGMAVEVDNQSDKPVYITYTGTVNGASLGDAQPLANITRILPGKKVRGWIVLDRTRLPQGALDVLRDCALTFQVYEKPTTRDADNALLFEADATPVAFDRLPEGAPADAGVFNDGDEIVIVDRDGIRMTLAAIRNMKNGGHILFGGELTNTTGKAVKLTCQLTINGWSQGGWNSTPIQVEQIGNGKSEYIAIVGDRRLSGIRFTSELESFELDFTVTDAGSGEKVMEFSTGTLYYNKQAPAGEAPAEEAPAGEAPAEEAPAGEAPVEEAPAEEAPVEEAPVEEAPAEEAPAEEAPVEEAPVEEAAAEEAAEYETLEKGSKGDAVVALQEKLIALGYLTGKADGDYGNGTAGAVEKFQEAEGLPVTGVADSETQRRLFAAEVPFLPDVTVESVSTTVTRAGALEVYARLGNRGTDTVDRVDFYVSCYNAYGELMKFQGTYPFVGCNYTEDIKPGKKIPSDWHWTIPGMSGAKKVGILIYKYHLKSGQTVEIPEADQVWQMFG